MQLNQYKLKDEIGKVSVGWGWGGTVWGEFGRSPQRWALRGGTGSTVEFF